MRTPTSSAMRDAHDPDLVTREPVLAPSGGGSGPEKCEPLTEVGTLGWSLPHNHR